MNKKRRKSKKALPPAAVAVIVLLYLVYLWVSTPTEPEAPAADGSVLQVHFIDVGQADCILIASQGKYMLVDAGNNEDAELITDYLDGMGVETLDYLIGTHPHEDHIGSLDAVIENFDVQTLIMPPVTTATKTFEDVLDAADARSVSITLPEVGMSYELGSAAFTIIAPAGEYGDELNDWSVGIRLRYGETAFVMCGDAEIAAEEDMLGAGSSLSADVLKLSHHGSTTSSSDEFIRAVNPEFAVISCGEGNSYGHPHDEIIEMLESRGIKYFRTDLQGSVVASSDGESITWNTEAVN